jgi:hypothetical protein
MCIEALPLLSMNFPQGIRCRDVGDVDGKKNA